MGKFRKADQSYSGHVGHVAEPRKCCHCRARTWLQLMCCALALELGVLISELAEKCRESAEQRVECDGAECDRVEIAESEVNKVIYQR